MIRIGEYCRLKAARNTDFGMYLTDGETDVLLPRRLVPEGLEPGDSLRVFVTTDSEDRPVATTLRPTGTVGEFVLLQAKEVGPVGAFMDWGLDKDLLIPFAEQHRRIEAGNRYLVRIVRDERTQRVFGSTKLGQYLEKDATGLPHGAEVAVIISDVGPDGARVVVDNQYFGMIFPDEIHDRLRAGDRKKGYVKRVREDGALAISLSPQGFSGAVEQGPAILERLRRAGGMLPYGDKSDPDAIRREFGLSKGSFKKAAGALMRAGQIDVEDYAIRLRRKP